MSDVTISELKKIKREIEEELIKQISEKLAEFHTRTGVCPAGISVSGITNHRNLNPEPDIFVVDGVNIEVELGL